MLANCIGALPTSITAGDTLAFTRTLRGYPASAGWRLAYVAVGLTSVYTFPGTPSADNFAVSVAATVTAAWTPGAYQLQEAVISADNSQRFTLGTTPLQVLPNLSAATAGIDARTHAQKMLDSIESYLEARTPTTMLIMIDGKRLEHYPLPDILAMRDRYRAEVALQLRRSGSGPSAHMLVRF